MVAMVRSWWKQMKQHPIAMLLNSCWQQIKHHKVKTLLIPFLIALSLTILIGGYRHNWAWTGFTGTTESYKTLYDWLQLLFVPVALTGFGFFLNYRERKAAERHADKERKEEERRADNERKIEENRAKTERDIAEDNQREAALQAYINKMSELLLIKNLRKSNEDSEVRTLARVRTLTALPRLDGVRKRSLLQFLYESGLINRANRIVYLKEADLKGANLHLATLMGADLSYADLSFADLTFCNVIDAFMDFAKLEKADLSHAFLINSSLVSSNLEQAKFEFAVLDKTNLSDASLENASLCYAFLNFANLTSTNLSGADLTKANLKGAIVTDEKLAEAKSLQGATMPDGSIYP
jgi:uncharacterized protein YjbI with pentapeptide repeats